MKVRDILKKMGDETYIAIGSKSNDKDKGTGTGFYYIGKIGRYWKHVERFNNYFELTDDLLEDRTVIEIAHRNIPGEPPMYRVLAEGSEQGKFWTLDEYEKQFDPKYVPIKNELADREGAQLLREAIVTQAVKDYQDAIQVGGGKAEIEAFFESDWGNLLSGADGKKIEEACRMMVTYKKWRKEHKCARCKTRNCAHMDGGDWTLVKRGKLICPKEGAESANSPEHSKRTAAAAGSRAEKEKTAAGG